MKNHGYPKKRKAVRKAIHPPEKRSEFQIRKDRIIETIDSRLGPGSGIFHPLDLAVIKEQSIRFLKRVKDEEGSSGRKQTWLSDLLKIAASVFILVVKEPDLNFSCISVRCMRIALRQR